MTEESGHVYMNVYICAHTKIGTDKIINWVEWNLQSA